MKKDLIIKELEAEKDALYKQNASLQAELKELRIKDMKTPAIELSEKQTQFLRAWHAAAHQQLKHFTDQCHAQGTSDSYQAWIKFLAAGHKELRNILLPGFGEYNLMADERLIDLFLKESGQDQLTTSPLNYSQC